ncbi:MAG: hypothetical protein ACO4AJ_14940, partial [Prochlorothrix sp.]
NPSHRGIPLYYAQGKHREIAPQYVDRRRSATLGQWFRCLGPVWAGGPPLNSGFPASPDRHNPIHCPTPIHRAPR